MGDALLFSEDLCRGMCGWKNSRLLRSSSEPVRAVQGRSAMLCLEGQLRPGAEPSRTCTHQQEPHEGENDSTSSNYEGAHDNDHNSEATGKS